MRTADKNRPAQVLQFDMLPVARMNKVQRLGNYFILPGNFRVMAATQVIKPR